MQERTKVRRFILLVLAAAITVGEGCALWINGPYEEITDATNDDLINEFYTVMSEETDLAALLFLGTDDTYDNAKALVQEKYFFDLADKWPTNVDNIEIQPSEIYLLLPKYKDTEMTVYERNIMHFSDEGIPLLTEVLATSNPLLLRCNNSDIFPSIEVKIEYNGDITTCKPSISLVDGSVIGGDRIYTEDILKWVQ